MAYVFAPGARLALRMVEDDDMSDVADAVGVGGYVITTVFSDRPGGATEVMTRVVAEFGHLCLGLVAHAESGDHARLRRLYERFGFVSSPYIESLMIRQPDLN